MAFWRIGRSLFGLYVFYLLAYKFVYGSGLGGNIVSVLSTLQQMLAGGILTALYFSNISDNFERSTKDIV